jgi:hypothetical protein
MRQFILVGQRERLVSHQSLNRIGLRWTLASVPFGIARQVGSLIRQDGSVESTNGLAAEEGFVIDSIEREKNAFWSVSACLFGVVGISSAIHYCICRALHASLRRWGL